MKIITKPGRSIQTGFSMMEVLTAIAVFSVGMAGMASLSLTSLQSTADGQFNSQAVFIAEEMADAMRSNLQAYESAQFVTTPATASKTCAPGSECTAPEQAQYDSGSWQTHTLTELPGGQAVICMDATPEDGNPDAVACDGNGMNTIKIFWRDARNQDVLAEGETFHRYVLTVVP